MSKISKQELDAVMLEKFLSAPMAMQQLAWSSAQVLLRGAKAAYLPDGTAQELVDELEVVKAIATVLVQFYKGGVAAGKQEAVLERTQANTPPPVRNFEDSVMFKEIMKGAKSETSGNIGAVGSGGAVGYGTPRFSND